jgi:hypothetical protein
VTRAAASTQRLRQLRGIQVGSAAVLTKEVFARDLRNRREVGAPALNLASWRDWCNRGTLASCGSSRARKGGPHAGFDEMVDATARLSNNGVVGFVIAIVLGLLAVWR